MGKDSVLLYITLTADMIEGLSREQRGDILTAILCDKKGEPLPAMDSLTKYVFTAIKKHIDRNEEMYADTCEKRRIAGKAGASKRWGNMANDSKCYENDSKNSKCYQMGANDSNPTENIAKIAYNDNDNDNEYDNDIIKESKKKSFVPPTLEEVQAYAAQRGREDLAKAFFDFFEAGDWHDSNGAAVKNWKQKFVTWEQRNTPKKKQLYATPKVYSCED